MKKLDFEIKKGDYVVCGFSDSIDGDGKWICIVDSVDIQEYDCDEIGMTMNEIAGLTLESQFDEEPFTIYTKGVDTFDYVRLASEEEKAMLDEALLEHGYKYVSSIQDIVVFKTKEFIKKEMKIVKEEIDDIKAILKEKEKEYHKLNQELKMITGTIPVIKTYKSKNTEVYTKKTTD